MSNESKTHYRKAFNSPYLSSADIVEPTVLTIARVVLEGDKSKKSKDVFNTAYFAEKEIRPGEALKPMILNAHNSRIMKTFAESAFIDDWNEIRVTIYVDHGVKFGREVVDGLRISPERPKVGKPALEPGDPMWDGAKAAFRRDGNLDKVLAKRSMSAEHVQLLKAECSE